MCVCRPPPACRRFDSLFNCRRLLCRCPPTPCSTAKPFDEATFQPLECTGIYRPAFEEEIEGLVRCSTADKLALLLLNS